MTSLQITSDAGTKNHMSPSSILLTMKWLNIPEISALDKVAAEWRTWKRRSPVTSCEPSRIAQTAGEDIASEDSQRRPWILKTTLFSKTDALRVATLHAHQRCRAWSWWIDDFEQRAGRRSLQRRHAVQNNIQRRDFNRATTSPWNSRWYSLRIKSNWWRQRNT